MNNQDQLQPVRQAAIDHVKSWNPTQEMGGRLHLDHLLSRLGPDAGRHVGAIYEFFWCLLRDGLAVPWFESGHRDARLQVSEVLVTPYGIETLTSNPPTAHDRLGLLAAFDELAPGLNESIRCAFEGALICFQTSTNYVGCAILLGVASEEVVDELVHATRMTESNKSVFQRQAGSTRATAADRAAAIQKIWAGVRDLPAELRTVISVNFPATANRLRSLRNKGGHPNKLGTPIQQELFTNLNTFPLYCREVMQLIDWMNEEQDRVL